MNSGKVVLGVLAGLAAGAIVGILFAPEKGSTTRKQILDKGGDYSDKLKAQFDVFCDSITQKFEGIGKEAGKLAANGKTKYDEAKER